MPSLLRSLSKAIKGSTTSKSSPALPSETAESLHDDPALHQAELHADASPEGGLACTNDQLLKEQRECITAWLASMGKKIFSGNFNLISTPFPVKMFEPRSYLEKLADAWVYPRYLHQASLTTDPVERMKFVITWFLAGLHHGFEKWKKPFNPILGETWQASLSDGSQMFMEQISHHPPVTAFNLEGPGGLYRYRGLSQPNVAIVLKFYGFKTMAKGFRQLDFADGSTIDIQYPGYYIKGVVYSSRPRAEVDGSAVFTDLKHGIRAVLRFGPNKGARAPILRRSDAIIGEIYEVAKDSVTTLPVTEPDEEMPELREEDSGDSAAQIANGAAGTAGCGDSDDYETASESDWELRAVHDLAERERNLVERDDALKHTLQLPQHHTHHAASNGTASQGEHSSSAGLDSARAHIDRIASAPSVHSQPQSQPQPLQSQSLPASQSRSTSRQPPRTPASNHATQGLQTASYDAVANVLDGLQVGEVASSSGRPSGSMRTSGSAGILSGWSRAMGMSASTSAPSCGTMGVGGEGAEGVGRLLARVEGSWLSHVNIGGQRYWTLRAERPDVWRPDPKALPSDSRYRKDLVMIQRGDVAAAQASKEELENIQRSDKKLREAGGAHVYHAS